jgi:formylglycine-generating enzyme required for sulfatase activity
MEAQVTVPPDAEAEDLVRVTRDQTAPRADRLAAGERLACLGDPRPGVLTLEPAWCSVDAGSFLMGSGSADRDAFTFERPQHAVCLPAFRISRYPVTNGQWHRFVTAGAYQEPRWWSHEGWRVIQASRGSASRSWTEQSWTDRSNRPVVRVSLYEALAYCRWLSARLAYEVRLCSEAEWEKAARGVDGRLYPFGDVLDADAVHAADPRPAADAAPVGCYPRGASPWGVEDIVGNTYAWTSSRWGPDEAAPAFAYPYAADDGREDAGSEDYHVVRGGAWSFPLRNVRCAYRGKDRPADAFDNLGLRLVGRA